MKWWKVIQFLRPWVMGLAIGLFGYAAATDPSPIYIGVMAGMFAMMIYSAITDVEEKLPKPKWPPIYITRDQIEEQPNITTDYIRIIDALRQDIEDREQVAKAQFNMAQRIDNGKEPDAKAPAEGYRMVARTNQRSATYLRNMIKVIEEDD